MHVCMYEWRERCGDRWEKEPSEIEKASEIEMNNS